MPTEAEKKLEEKIPDLNLIKPALAAVEDDPARLYKMGLDYYNKENRADIALLCFEKAKALNPSDELLAKIETATGNICHSQEKWDEAVAAYERAAAKNSADAYLSLAGFYCEGKVVPKDLELALKYLNRAYPNKLSKENDSKLLELSKMLSTKVYEEKGSAKLLNDSGHLLLRVCSYCHSNDYSQALLCYEAAAQQGFAEAYANLSKEYRSGSICQKDLEKSKKYAEEAAKLGDYSAVRKLGDYYRDNEESKEAYEYYKRVADSVDPNATKVDGDDIRVIERIGDFYYKGIGVEADKEKAVDYYIKALLVGRGWNNSDIRQKIWKHFNCGNYSYDRQEITGFYEAACADSSGEELNKLGVSYVKKWRENELLERLSSSPDINLLVKAFICFKASAQKGYVQAFSNLGVLYHNEYPGFNDIKKAIAYYQQAIEKGDEDAIYLLGAVHLDNREAKQAYERFQEAAAKGNFKALKKLGDRAQSQGRGSEALDYYLQAAIAGGSDNEEVLKAMRKNFTKNFELSYLPSMVEEFLKIAKANPAEANYRLGLFYYNSSYFARDMEKMRIYFKKAIEADYFLAANALGNAFRDSGNYAEAHEYYQVAADKGVAAALINLGDLYRDGQGVQADEEKAQTYYLKALENRGKESKESEAIHERVTGRLKIIDRVLISSLDEIKAIENDPEALYKLGIEFQEKKAHKEALTCLEAAAKLGHVAAYTAMGNSYRAMSDRCRKPLHETNERDAELIKRYEEKAFKFYDLAAKQDDATASLNLGYQYLYGRGVTVNFDEALACFETAKAKGLPQVDTIIGNLYLYRQDYEKAYEHFLKDAVAGVGLASYKLGYLYQNAMLEVKEASSADLALQYYTQACAQGFKPAEKALAQLTPLEWREVEEFNKAKTDPASKGEALYQLGLKYDQAGAYAKACFCFKAAEKWEHEGALYQLGCYYANGKAELVERDYKKAESYFNNLIAKNRVEGYLGLGQLYESRGETTTAIPYLSRAAEEGNTAAQLALGAIYSRDSSRYSSIINGLDFYELANKEGIQGLRQLKDKSGPMWIWGDPCLKVDCYLAALSLADALLAQPDEDKEAVKQLQELNSIRPIVVANDFVFGPAPAIHRDVEVISKPYIQGLWALKNREDIEAIKHFKEVKQQLEKYRYRSSLPREVLDFFHAKACLHLAALYEKTPAYFPYAMQEYQEDFERAGARSILRKSIMAKLDNLAKDQAYMSRPELMRTRVSCLWREAQFRLAANDQEQAEKYLRLAFGLSVKYGEEYLSGLKNEQDRQIATTTANQIAYEYANFIKEKNKEKELGLLEILCKRDFLPALLKLATYKLSASPKEAIALFQRALNLALEKNDFPALFSTLKGLKTFYNSTPSFEYQEAIIACFKQIFSSPLLLTQQLDWEALRFLEEVAKEVEKETGRQDFSLKVEFLHSANTSIYSDYLENRTAAALLGRTSDIDNCASRYLRANDFGRGMLFTCLSAVFDSKDPESHIATLRAVDPSSSLTRTFFQKQDTEELKLMKGILLDCLTNEQSEAYLPALRKKYNTSDPLLLLFLLLKKIEGVYFMGYTGEQIGKVQARIEKSIKLMLRDNLRLRSWEKWTSAEKIYDQKWKEMESLVDKVEKQEQEEAAKRTAAAVSKPERVERRHKVRPPAKDNTKMPHDEAKALEEELRELEEEQALRVEEVPGEMIKPIMGEEAKIEAREAEAEANRTKEIEKNPDEIKEIQGPIVEKGAVIGTKEAEAEANQGKAKEASQATVKAKKKGYAALSGHHAVLFNPNKTKAHANRRKTHKPHTGLTTPVKTITNKS